MLDVHKWECSHIVDERDDGWVALGKDGLGKMQRVSQLLTLTCIGIPLHDVLPLLEDLHGMELLKKGQVTKDVFVDAISDELLI